ncbi:hypothetical protein [Kribbella qitaiheensis]|uniref:hypothetical protein n=1 Tax=Kribbella qitaiheensis TaxID=1544730 RepID=UPI001626C111|nr:hypothetical protein [Kribbella qitaiheensis]
MTYPSVALVEGIPLAIDLGQKPGLDLAGLLLVGRLDEVNLLVCDGARPACTNTCSESLA